MNDVNNKKLWDTIKHGIEQANLKKCSQLVSVTQSRISSPEPVMVFSNARRLGLDCSFWMTPDHDFTMVGVGKAHILTSDSNSYTELENEWSMIQDQMLIHNTHQVPGTGPVAVGGMAFDADKRQSGLWHAFDTNKLVIPRYVYVCHQRTCYLTVNIWIHELDETKQVASQLRDQIDELITSNDLIQMDLPDIQKQEAIAAEAWKEAVQKATKAIEQGDMDKVVLARELRVYFTEQVNDAAVLINLLRTQGNSYIFAFQYQGDCFIGASPEQLVKVETGNVFSMCLAGTTPRGSTKNADDRLADDLLSDAKNRQEHDFVVKMIKNALDGHCQNIVIPKTPQVHRLENLQHLYTPVTAELKPGKNVFDLVQSLHPTPALGGTPQKTALSYIRNHEQMDRGWYGAPIGWMDTYDNSEFAVAIRSGLIQGREASLFAGCGIVTDSEPEAEYAETAIKLKPMLNALGG